MHTVAAANMIGVPSRRPSKLIVTALEAEHGNKVAAAKRLGISRSYLHRLISEFGIQARTNSSAV